MILLLQNIGDMNDMLTHFLKHVTVNMHFREHLDVAQDTGDTKRYIDFDVTVS